MLPLGAFCKTCDLHIEIFSLENQGPQTVLMKDCPQKWLEKSFKENDIFFSMKKIVILTLELYTQVFFALDK